MQPIANAIDEIQGDVDMYMGALIPTILYVINALRDLDADHPLEFLEFFRDGLIEAVESRFRDILCDDKRKLASAYHPLYKTGWATTQGKADLRTLVITDLERNFPRTLASGPPSEPSGSSRSARHGARGLRRVIISSFRSTNPPNQARACVAGLVSSVTLFLEDVPVNEEGDEHLVATWRAQLTDARMRDQFIKYNTPLPSSASVERLFSVGKDILVPKRCRLTDFNFEMVMFLRINMHLLNDVD